MIFEAKTALSTVEKILSMALAFQTIELLQLRKIWSEKGIWRWSLLRQDFLVFPAGLRAVLDFLLTDRTFLILLGLRLAASVLLFFNASLVVVLFLWLSSVLISLRWRGAFNGGSDFMTLILLFALSLLVCFPESRQVEMGCLWYISIQSCTSYFLAGFAKLRSAGWRNGGALPSFLTATVFGPRIFLLKFSRHSLISRTVAWSLIFFECTFPFSLLNPRICLTYLGAGLVFHYINFLIFGLNRFFFVWAATYPALYFCSQGGF